MHNILAERGFAYLADEVGMGKTYVALGVVGLLRHFHPGLRVLYVVPRSNLQDKWRKEARNFAANNWKLPDLRVKTLQGTPTVDMVVCDSLDHFVHEAHANANRDFVLRMSSFSLALRGDAAGWKKKRRTLRKLLPWLPASAFDLRDKTRFKQTYARAINAAIPRFDLLVVDEAHNFRHGYEHGSTRNQLLGLVLGIEDEDIPYMRGGGPRVDRVLALSATPLETNYLELWNQLSLFGASSLAPELKDSECPADEQQRAAQRFMVRRLTGLALGEHRYTKNMYRREWRRGGVDTHGEPLRMADDRERLVVALVQKKVSDVLAQLGRGSGRTFGRRFQMGMLASFESFLETVKLAGTEDDPAFDQADQTDDELEREGVDAVSIAHLARSHRERFQEPLPHPKMNAVASALAEALEGGEKTLVFVRRVASVPELVAKVAQRYDRWLCEKLERSAPGVADQIRRQLRRYRTATSRAEGYDEPSDDDELASEDDDLAEVIADDTGSDSFFAWFFRGERKLGVASGGWFRRRRLTDEKEELSLLLEDNYLGWLLGLAQPTLEDLAAVVGVEPGALGERLRARAYAIFREASKQTRFPIRRVFRAYQQAALAEIGGSEHDLAARARSIARQRGWTVVIANEGPVPTDFPDPGSHLGRQTLFSILGGHPLGQDELRLDGHGARSIPIAELPDAFRRRELLRELLSTALSLGHPFVELWATYVALRGTLQRSAPIEPSVEQLAGAFLDRLSAQPHDSTGARQELAALVQHFDLILDVNFPDARDKPLAEIPKYYQSALSRQTPVGGMSGRINASMVRQFRMPGYPYVLITTDVLQEGEDLHTFASRVMHYGITWTPSAMEQRTGRVDRIGSLTHRRLTERGAPDPREFLQVQFPYLDSTIELVQARRIFRRMDDFVALLHQGLGADEAKQSAIDLASAIHERTPIKEPSTSALQSPFDVDRKLLYADRPLTLGVSEAQLDAYDRHLGLLVTDLPRRARVEWSPDQPSYGRLGTAWIDDGKLIVADEPVSSARQQPFALYLRGGSGLVLLQLVSPVGVCAIDDEATIARLFELQTHLVTAKICAVVDDVPKTYNLTVEVEVPFSPETFQLEEALSALARCVAAADVVERELLGTDQPLSVFAADLSKEIGRG
ncbi:DEAD/DEAH box helicase family protein [Paraliomyxa miuraensis]|nr:DEAD/DEAH box helicase family protein [Paraliomyxa miuraensis]